MKDELTWRVLKTMYSLYLQKKIPVGQKPHSQLKYLKDRRLIGHPLGNSKLFVAIGNYKSYFEKNFLEDYICYEEFLHSINPDTDGRNTCTIKDLNTLIFINEQREEIKRGLTTRHTFSTEIFKYGGTKYLENRPGLEKLVFKILQIDRKHSLNPVF